MIYMSHCQLCSGYFLALHFLLTFLPFNLGEACRALEELAGRKRPKVFAIGGIDASNCHIPVGKYGADGIATIRAVLEAEDPGESVRLIRENMMKC
jgi:thiamine monophosphate synthase